jgi:hypothetical protein
MSTPKSLVSLGENLCLSGGADGADLQWGMMAGHIGHSVIHWSFQGHKSQAPACEVVVLDDTSLGEADVFLKRANLTLKRRFPGKNRFVNNLLRRNYFQVRWSESVYGVGLMLKGQVHGGTAWATQMYMDRFIVEGEPMENCKLYFYDQTLDQWMKWQGDWQVLNEQPPEPIGIWTGIGTRELSHTGKWAIRNVLGGYVVPTP